MLLRALVVVVFLALPIQAQASHYVVRAGDSLVLIAQRYHLSVQTLARINSIRNINLLQIGRVLFIPRRAQSAYYRVHWGDTLTGIGARYGESITSLRAMNPGLGAYPLAGQILRVCTGCSGYRNPTIYRPTVRTSVPGRSYLVRAGDSLSNISVRYGTTTSALLQTNRLANPNRVIIGSRLVIPASIQIQPASYGAPVARALVVDYARRYGLNSALPVAVAWQESGFNQNMVSGTGAIGVMQVEPYTGRHISWLLGRPFNLSNLDDNIHAGVFWLSQLVAYYNGDERLAAAAYYEGAHNLAVHGWFQDTIQYVNNVMALRARFTGQ